MTKTDKARQGDGGGSHTGPPYSARVLGVAEARRKSDRDVQGGGRQARPSAVLLSRRLPDQPGRRRPHAAPTLGEHARRVPEGGRRARRQRRDLSYGLA